MKCSRCGNLDSKVLDNRIQEDGTIRRRRECNNCKTRFTTCEKIVKNDDIYVVKSNKSRQLLDMNKVRLGIMKACDKTEVSITQIDQVVDKIENQIIEASVHDEISAKEIGKFVMEHLKQLNEVAYLRYASVYKKFREVIDFIDEINSGAKKK